jgi:hypothetical protein
MAPLPHSGNRWWHRENSLAERVQWDSQRQGSLSKTLGRTELEPTTGGL